jgi:hypothetical protein
MISKRLQVWAHGLKRRLARTRVVACDCADAWAFGCARPGVSARFETASANGGRRVLRHGVRFFFNPT